MLTVRDDELGVGDDEYASSEAAEESGTRGRTVITWMGMRCCIDCSHACTTQRANLRVP